MAQLARPQLRVGGLSKKVYIITHGRETRAKGRAFLDASRKYDSTDQFEAVARELGWTPPAVDDC